MQSPENRYEKKKLTLAGCVIIRDNKILLLHRIKTDWFELPGGQVEAGETPAIAAQRELKEELSCDVSLGEKIGAKNFVENGQTMEYQWFRASIPEDQMPIIGEPEKFDRFEWISIYELALHKLSPNMKNLVEHLV
mgnify:CR=1 FL=1